MKKLFYILLFCLIAATPAFADTTFYVDDDGAETTWEDCNDGVKSGAAACTLAVANANAAAGDIVYLRAGTYTGTAIHPTASGTDGSPITYAQYGAEEVIIEGISPIINLISGEDWIVIDGIDTAGVKNMILSATDADNIELKNCHLTSNRNNQTWFSIDINGGSSNWNIHDNVFDVALVNGMVSGEYSGSLIEFTAGGYHYIHDNDFVDGQQHDYLMFKWSGHNIVKDNNFYNTGTYITKNNGPREILVLILVDNILIEGNVFYEHVDNRGDNAPVAIQLLYSSYNIIRKNSLRHLDLSGVYTNNTVAANGTSEYNRIYNNTLYDTNHTPDQTNFGPFVLIQYSTGSDIQYNIFKNNIISGSGARAFTKEEATGGKIHDNLFDGNWVYNIDTADEVSYNGSQTLLQAETNQSSIFKNNSPGEQTDLVDPLLNDPTNGDMTLNAASPCIDAGQWLTTITTANGSGDQFAVADPYYFFDGYGIITGDVIRTSLGQTATIIDVTGTTITVNASISWTQNEGIALDYNGTAPDIGAEEIDVSPPTVPTVSGIPSIAGDGVTVTVTFSEDVVMTGYDANDFDLDCTGAGNIGLVYSSGTGTDTIIFTSGSTIYTGTVCTLDFDASVDADDIVDTATPGNALVTFSNYEVDNNSYQNLNMPGIYGVSFQ